ncbi:unannotated protein [freshwater metagenome]|uniref:Unannotated protein n=1 Tax=freshwater metagenome TaxID=449393 RepID=A0A6J6PHS6_9ZZZZ
MTIVPLEDATAAGAAGVATTGATGAGGGVTGATATGISTGATGALGADAVAPSAITASSAPTATVESTATIIFCKTPATGDGISVSTLSVETSRSGSSTAITSPSFLSQRVTVPSVTDSPSAGIVTEKVILVSPVTRVRVVVYQQVQDVLRQQLQRVLGEHESKQQHQMLLPPS